MTRSPPRESGDNYVDTHRWPTFILRCRWYAKRGELRKVNRQIRDGVRRGDEYAADLA